MYALCVYPLCIYPPIMCYYCSLMKFSFTQVCTQSGDFLFFYTFIKSTCFVSISYNIILCTLQRNSVIVCIHCTCTCICVGWDMNDTIMRIHVMMLGICIHNMLTRLVIFMCSCLPSQCNYWSVVDTGRWHYQWTVCTSVPSKAHPHCL